MIRTLAVLAFICILFSGCKGVVTSTDLIADLISSSPLQINDTQINEDSLATIIRSDAAVQAIGEDVAQNPVAYTILPASSNDCQTRGSVSINVANGEIMYQPTADYTGVCSIKVQFTGASGVYDDEFNVSVLNVNDKPIFSASCSALIKEDDPYACSFSVTDIDPGETVQLQFVTNTCAWASINGLSVEGSPDNSEVGSCSFQIVAHDGDESSAASLTQGVVVSNNAPILTIAGTSPLIPYGSGVSIVRSATDVASTDEGVGAIGFSAVAATAPACSSNGSVSVNSSNGEVTFDPNNTYSGTCNIKVSFDDGHGGVVEDEFAVTVQAGNTAPIISAACSTSIAEDAAYSCAPSVLDPDDAVHTWSLDTSNSCLWASINSGSGAISGTPNDNQVGGCTLAFKSNDGAADSSILSYSISVTNVAPTLTIANAASINEDVGAAVVRNDLAVEASDEGFGSYSLIAASAPACVSNGSVGISVNEGDVTFTPALNYTGTCNINVSFADGNGGVASDEFSVTVTAVNDAPSIAGVCQSAVVQGALLSCSPVATDPDNGTHTWSTTAAHTCLWASINSASGVVSGTPNDNQVGTCTIAFKANDGSVDSNILSNSVSVTNVTPTLTIADAISILEDAAAAVIRDDLAVQASEEGFGLYSLVASTAPACSANGTVSINPSTGAVTYAPATNYSGICNINVSFDDGNLGVVSDEFAITVTGSNDAPVISATCAASINEDAAYSCAPSAADADTGDTQTWSFQTGPHTCAWATINSSSGVIGGTPSDDQVGPCTLAFKSNDATVDSNVLATSVTIVNVTPLLTIADAGTINYGSAAMVVRNDAAVQASDEGFGLYSLNVSTAPACSDNGVVSINTTNGAVTYDPTNTYNGSCNINVSFDDGNAGGIVSDEFAVIVDVNPNVAPVITASCATNGTQDIAYSCTPSVTDGNAGDTQTWSFTGANTCTWASINSGTGSISFTPTDSQVGACTLAFKSNDAQVDSNILSYTVSIANVAPTLTIANVTILEDAASATIRGDADVEASEEGFGVYSLDNATATAPKCSDNGTLSINTTDGDITFQPTANYSGVCNVKVVFDDQNLSSNTVATSFNVTVTGSNDAPVITASCSTSATEDVAYLCSPSVNDNDAGDTQTWSLAGTNTCTWASINSGTGSISVTPTDNNVGPCTLAFKSNDLTVDSNILSYAVTVANVAPTMIIADAAAIAEDAIATEIRADSDVAASDEGFGTYSLIAATAPACNSNGTVSINPSNGAVTYTPALNYNGTCNMNVSFDDGNTGIASDEFAITVTPANDAPVISAACPTSVNQDAGYACSSTFVDPDNASQNWSLDTSNTCLWAGISSTSGSVTGTPDDNEVGTCTLAFKSNDGFVDSNVLSYSVTVNNIAPILSIANAAAILEDAASTIIRADVDVQANEETFGVYSLITATGTQCSANGTVLLDATTGEVRYQPALNYNGTCNIKVQFDDQNAASNLASAEFSITVIPINDAPVITASCATTVSEGAAYSCTPSVADPDSGSFTWTFDATDDCAWDTINSSSGAISGTPLNSHVGSCTLAFNVSDGILISSVESITVTVGNVLPTLSISDTSIAEDAASSEIRNDAAVEASEEGFGTYSLSAATGTACSANGTVSISASEGSVTYQPAANFDGTCNINVSFDDGNGTPVSDEFAVVVIGSNDAPIANASCSLLGTQDTAYSCTSSVTDVDTGDAQLWSFDTTNSCGWAVLDMNSGAISGTPDDDQVGSCVIAYKSSDTLLADSNILSFSISVGNVAPLLVIADAGTINYGSAAMFVRNDAAVQASDEGFGSYSLSASTAPACSDNGLVTINATSGAVTYDPTDTYNGTCNINVSFDDGNAGGIVSDEFAVIVDVNPNVAPVITASCATTGTQGVAYSCTPSVTDGNAGDTQTWSFTGANTCTWASINSGTGSISFTSTDNQVGSCTLAFKSNDAQVDSNILSYSVVIANVTPTLSIANVTISEDAASATIRGDADVEASEETFGVYSLDNATVATPKCSDNGSLGFDPAEGAITFQPSSNYSGVCNVKVVFDDGNASNNLVSSTFTVTVTNINDVPSISGSCSGTVTQDSTFACAPTVFDPDSGNTQTWSFAGNTCAWASINSSTGSIGGTPNDDQVTFVPCTLAFKSNDGTVDSNILSYPITVTNVAPTLTILDAAAISEDSVSTQVRSNADVAASEEGFGSYSVIAASGQDCALPAQGSVFVDPSSGYVNYTPALNYAATCNIRIQFDDGNGGTVSDEFAVTVNAVNDMPVITQACATNVNQGAAYSCTPTVADPDDSTFTWSFVGTDTCAWDLIDGSGGAISGTPNDNEVGSCDIAFKVNDGDVDSLTTAVSVTVNNVAPILSIVNPGAINEDSGTVVIRADADVAASEEGFGAYSIVTPSGLDCSVASQGSVSIVPTTGQVTYTPALNYNGTCNIGVMFNDGNTASGNNTVGAQFAVTVNAVNDAPYFTTSCTSSATEDVGYACTPTITDPDGPASTLSLDATNTCAWASVSGSSINGTPNNSHVGSCDLKYSVSDGFATSAVATVNVTVSNTAPTLTISGTTISEDAALAVIRDNAAVQASDEGFGSGVYSLIAATAPSCNTNGTVSIIPATGAVTYAPAANYNGFCNIKVQFDDGNGGIVAAQFAVTVNAVNDAPSSITWDCNTSATQGVLYSCTANSSDVDGDTLTWSYDTGHTCTWLGAISQATRVISGTPNDNDVTVGCDLRIKVTDGNGGLADINTSIAVSNVNPQWIVSKSPADIGTVTIIEDAASAALYADSAVESNEEGFGSYSLVTPAVGTNCQSVGTSSINADGVVTFQPSANYSGTCTFKISFNDGNPASTSIAGEFSVSVNPVDDVPSVTATVPACPVSATTGAAYSCGAPSSGADIDGGTNTWVKLGSSTCTWANVSSSNGSISGTPSVTGICTIDYRLQNAGPTAWSNTLTVSVNVTGGAPPPIPTLTANPTTGSSSTFAIEATGVPINDTVTLYSDSGCTTTVVSATVTGATTSFLLTAPVDGVYAYWAKATNVNGSSSCSTSASYTRTSAAVVGGNTIAGYSGICADGQVNAFLPVAANRMILGGAFKSLGKCVGNGVVADKTTGLALTLPIIDGAVNAVVTDNSGGWYIGGTFTKVGGFAVNSLAHIFSNGTVDTGFNLNVNAGVSSLTRDGNEVIIGGSFTLFGTTSCRYYAVLDTSSSTLKCDLGANGDILTAAVAGPDLYVGGSFTKIGAISSANILNSSGISAPISPRVNGNIESVAFDSLGNMYIAGSFTSVNGSPRNNIARINADGSLDNWAPIFSGAATSINAIAFANLGGSSPTIFVGGSFTDITISSTTYSGFSGVAAFTVAASPVLQNFQPVLAANTFISPTIYSIAATSAELFIGGNFKHGGGASLRTNFVMFPSINVTAGNPGVAAWGADTNDTIRAMKLVGTSLYVGGDFTFAGGTTRNRAAKFTNILTAGALDPTFNPNINGPVYAIEASGMKVYLGGTFGTINGSTARNNFAIVSSTNGAAGTAIATGSVTDTVMGLALSGTSLYIAGDFTTFGASARNRLAAIDTSTDALGAWNPDANGVVNSIAAWSGLVGIGGSYDFAGGLPRNNLALIDRTTESVDLSFAPDPSGTVKAVVTDGTSVYVGGLFVNIAGQSKNYLAKLDSLGTLDTTFSPAPSASVYTLALSGSTLYAGGVFATIGGQSRTRLAALNSTNGLATAWAPSPDGIVNDIQVSGSRVFVGGAFYSFFSGTQTRIGAAAFDIATGSIDSWSPNVAGSTAKLYVDANNVFIGGAIFSADARLRRGLGAVDSSTRELTDWAPQLNAGGYINAMSASATHLYFGGLFTTVNTISRTNLSAVSLSDGTSINSWAPYTNNPVTSLLYADTRVFFGGTFSTVNGSAKNKLAEVDVANGTLQAWSPEPNATVFKLLRDGTTLYVGGGFTTIAAQSRSGLASFDITAAPTINAFAPTAGANVYALAISGTNLYVGGTFAGYLKVVHKTTAVAGTSASVNGAVFSLVPSSDTLTIYAAGAFTSVNSTSMPYVAALVASTAANKAGFTSAATQGIIAAQAHALAISGSHIYFGGNVQRTSSSVRWNMLNLDIGAGTFAP